MSASKPHVTVIDGGFSTQLARYVGSNIDGDPLWSARFNAVNPEAVIQSHLDFLESGAEIILTNTYQTSIEGYQEYLNLDYASSFELMKSTVKLAHIARDKFMSSRVNVERKPLIFASIGPYGAHLHDGSEYTGSYEKKVSAATIKKWHKIRIDACVEVGVDGLAIETIPCLMEAKAVVDLILDDYPDMKFWVSFQCKVVQEESVTNNCEVLLDGLTVANGEDFSYAIDEILKQVARRKSDNLVAIGINCIHPSFVSTLLKSAKASLTEMNNTPFVVYPNSGEVYTVEAGWHGKNDCIPLEDYVEDWIKLGARYIGGCCRNSSEDIKKIRQKVDEIMKN